MIADLRSWLRGRIPAPLTAVALMATIAMTGAANGAGPLQPETVAGENDLSLIAAAEKGDLEGIAKAMRAGASIAATKFYEPAPGRTWYVGLSAATNPW